MAKSKAPPAPSLELNLELAENENAEARPFVDPRKIPTRYSLLKKMAQSPAHYLEACQEQEEDESIKDKLAAFASDRKEAFRVGSAIDVMIKAPSDEEARRQVIVTSLRRDPRSKDWQNFQKDAVEEGVKEILIASEMAIVRGVVDALRARPDAMKLLLDGTIVEQRIDWNWMGKAVRSTPDARCKKYTVDLKSAVSSEPEAFKRQSRKLFYHCQAELYARAMDSIGEGWPADAYVIAVEKSRPHPVTIFRFTAEMLEVATKTNRLWMERLLGCEAANHWPDYAPAPAVIDLDVDEPQIWEAA